MRAVLFAEIVMLACWRRGSRRNESRRSAPATSINTHGDCPLGILGGPEQSSAVLGVKPAIEDVDADCFLAFRSALLKTESSPTTRLHAFKFFDTLKALSWKTTN
jgi:hypothetical protein